MKLSTTMTNSSIDTILAPKPEPRLRIYAYEIHSDSHDGLLKIGQITRDVKTRAEEQNHQHATYSRTPNVEYALYG
jgi:hypothetical protein